MCATDEPEVVLRRRARTTAAKPMVEECCRTKAQETCPKVESSSSQRTIWSDAVLGVCAASLTTLFSVWFPFFLAPHAARQTYDWAFWHYDPELSHFDNTIWTYGTDYALAAIMGCLAYWIYTTDDSVLSRAHRIRSAGLLLCYTASVLAGGYAHQTYTTLESRNSWSFRFLWTICVGTVTAASGFMGSIGSELVRQLRTTPAASSQRNALSQWVPLLSEVFWTAFAVTTTLVCFFGGLSFQRPACDIFIAGTTQFPSTVYIMALIAFCMQDNVYIRHLFRVIGLVGFIANAPLLPMYPLMVVYTDWTLASVNTLCHLCLLLAWSMQGISLQHYCVAIAVASRPTSLAVPIKKH